MTEADWWLCDDPTPMLEVLRGRASPRKLGLFAVAFSTRVRPLCKATRPCPTASSVPPHAADIEITGDLAEARRVQNQIEAALAACRFTEHDVFSIKLALEEALVKAIKHG